VPRILASTGTFGLVVDDRSRVRDLVCAAGAILLEGNFLDFLDPWGNRVQVVEYRDIQFAKAPKVLRNMNFLHLEKTDEARKQLADKGIVTRTMGVASQRPTGDAGRSSDGLGKNAHGSSSRSDPGVWSLCLASSCSAQATDWRSNRYRPRALTSKRAARAAQRQKAGAANEGLGLVR
jgi:prophage tail gpP-like protein